MEITQKIVALKLPEKYRFTGGVMGNGMALGLSDGTINGGLGRSTATVGHLDTFKDNYGATLPGGTSSGVAALTKAVGLTTDPEKSGITLEKEPWIVFIAF